MSVVFKTFPIPKEEWGEGEWQNEPDRAEWISKEGFPCLARRIKTGGHWCAYVGVPKGNKYHGINAWDAEELKVHGGITWACANEKEDKGERINHGCSNEDTWWLGFDCAHWNDLQPGIEALINHERKPCTYMASSDGVYKDLVFVVIECNKLAQQLKVIDEPN